MNKSGPSITKQAIYLHSGLVVGYVVFACLDTELLASIGLLACLFSMHNSSEYIFPKKALNLIANRLKVGAAEKENTQKITQAVIGVFFTFKNACFLIFWKTEIPTNQTGYFYYFQFAKRKDKASAFAIGKQYPCDS
jgi:hypothetical protein